VTWLRHESDICAGRQMCLLSNLLRGIVKSIFE